MKFFDELQMLGVDVDEGVDRLMGNVDLYERMLMKFADMLKETPVTDDFNNDNCEETIQNIHALKGAAGNLSIRPLYEAYTEIVNLLRAGEILQAKDEIRRILPAQENIVECIRRHGQEDC